MLNDEQIAHLEKRLHEERAEALDNLRGFARDIETAETSTELSNIPTHPADRGSEVQEESIDVALAEQQASRLRAIDDALTRLRENPAEFDVSMVSGLRIPYERLELLPWTRVRADEQPDAAGARGGRSPGGTEESIRRGP
jgi:RNA polymerase-binding transcription factor DksA